jgi:hypothetical protein
MESRESGERNFIALGRGLPMLRRLVLLMLAERERERERRCQYGQEAVGSGRSSRILVF